MNIKKTNLGLSKWVKQNEFVKENFDNIIIYRTEEFDKIDKNIQKEITKKVLKKLNTKTYQDFLKDLKDTNKPYLILMDTPKLPNKIIEVGLKSFSRNLNIAIGIGEINKTYEKILKG